MFAGLKRISTAIAVTAAVSSAATARAQVAPVNANQTTADAVAASIGGSPALLGQRIAVEARQGLVVLTGAVSTPDQHREVIARARSVPGVSAVQDFVKVVPDAMVRP